jgi:hypothetical protein
MSGYVTAVPPTREEVLARLRDAGITEPTQAEIRHEYVKAIVAQAPPMSPETRDFLRGVLGPVARQVLADKKANRR